MRKGTLAFAGAVLLACVGLVGVHALHRELVPTPQVTAAPSAAAAPWGASGKQAPEPDAATLSSTVKERTTAGAGSYKVSVRDVATGQELVDQDAASTAAPASSLKLLTGSAALDQLGPDHRFTTRAVQDGDQGITLVGGGDVLLGSGASDAKATNGHAGLGTLAESTVKALVQHGTSGDVTVHVDSSLFTDPGLNPEWAADLVTSNNITEVQTPALYAGRSTADHHSAVVRNPADHALSAYVSALSAAAKKDGADLSFSAGGHATAGSDAQELASVESATVLQQLHYMEDNSDNYLAEAMGRLVSVERGGEGSIEGATQAVTAVVKDLGVDVTGLDMKDTSGLAATNRISPATLTGMLAVAQSDKAPQLRDLAELLPVSGVSGTLSSRLSGTDTKALIRAKTGTLADVVSLTGYVTTADGRLLSFSVMASDLDGNLLGARNTADAIAAYLAGCGCGG